MKKCKNEAIEGVVKKQFKIVQEKCKACGLCYKLCPAGAILKDGQPRPAAEAQKVRKARINKEACLGCRNCFMSCPNRVISYKTSLVGCGHCVVNEKECLGCGSCLGLCMNDCIKMVLVESSQRV